MPKVPCIRSRATFVPLKKLMNDEGALHHKTNEVCTTEDVESVD